MTFWSDDDGDECRCHRVKLPPKRTFSPEYFILKRNILPRGRFSIEKSIPILVIANVPLTVIGLTIRELFLGVKVQVLFSIDVSK